MKKTLFLSILLCLFLFCQLDLKAASKEVVVFYEKEILENGYYIETVITEDTVNISPLATSTTKTGKKTATCKDSDGNTVWSITVYGTFTYDGTTSKCTAVSMSKSIKASNWSLSNLSCSKSGSSCKASATGKLTTNGTVIQTINKTITLKCSAKGVLS